jgi:hypothetical protein
VVLVGGAFWAVAKFFGKNKEMTTAQATPVEPVLRPTQPAPLADTPRPPGTA